MISISISINAYRSTYTLRIERQPLSRRAYKATDPKQTKIKRNEMK